VSNKCDTRSPVASELHYVAGTMMIQFPDSAFTDAWDINAAGEIVGEYQDQTANPTIHGYLLTGGKYTSIDFPGAGLTWAFGINDRGEVVGFYLDSAGGQHAFLFRSHGQ